MIIAELSGEEPDLTAFLGAIDSCVDMTALMREQLIAIGMPAGDGRLHRRRSGR